MFNKLKAANAVLTFTVALTFFPADAWALSCARPDLARSYEFWAKSEKHYALARGTLAPAGELPAKRTNNIDEQDNEFLEAVPFIFSGVLIGRHKSSPVSMPVTVQPNCVAVWCGGYPGNEEAIYAFEKTASGFRFSPSPCGGNSFTGDTNAHEQFLQQCMNAGSCKE